MQQCLNDFLPLFPLARNQQDIDTDTVSRIASSSSAVDSQLFDTYHKALRRGVEQTFADECPDLSAQLLANVSRFAAYKAASATAMIHDAVADSGDLDDGIAALHAHRRWLAAEANTATARARTAKQWQEFSDPDRLRLFPNLEWLPSRSATPREAHQAFYHLILPKEHSFWQRNQPGNLWNCKCDWQETDQQESIPHDPVKDKDLDVDNIEVSARGMEGNPATTGMIFSKQAGYFKNTSAGIDRQMVNLYYESHGVQISAIADHSEIADNLKSARIILENKAAKSIKILPHLSQECGRTKNPEYEIDGAIADAKRIRSNNVADSFLKAKKQNCSVVVIDTVYTEHLRVYDIAKNIAKRMDDFTNGTIQKCIVIVKGKCYTIDRSFFPAKPSNNRNSMINTVTEKIWKSITGK